IWVVFIAAAILYPTAKITGMIPVFLTRPSHTDVTLLKAAFETCNLTGCIMIELKSEVVFVVVLEQPEQEQCV
ncbi:hypothetical protein EST38_g11988, partial [Candolleomyces aberdarensis]